MESWESEYERMIDDCEKRESRLSEWEQGFISSISSQMDKGKSLTPPQIDTLESIWERVTARG
jgi:hypothetical protein